MVGLQGSQDSLGRRALLHGTAKFTVRKPGESPYFADEKIPSNQRGSAAKYGDSPKFSRYPPLLPEAARDSSVLAAA